ncbi:GNAT family N-acetyltransferase [Leptospira sp. 201903075]|uniref:GNAT family N-acetyltransferase n=1 Tax=Leptospira chreensis TaxID=2810035 RepID=UPI0019648FF9|nr:GNAT family N-acetyltransferase [Leptospira chreensis]MBM9590939.1 GNAT family N-acetyltransferase [Leptospira chreensis]
MITNFKIRLVDQWDSNTKLCVDNLWEEIQDRYGFKAPNPMDPNEFLPPKGRFWIAEIPETGEPMGSVAYTKYSSTQCELDAVYVFPKFRNQQIANSLLIELEKQTKIDGYTSMILRAGEPQTEALAFYKKFGFTEIPKFGKWVSDPTAVCFEKIL